MMINAPISFKDDVVQEQFKNAPLLLQMVVEDFCNLCLEYGITPVMTRVLEFIANDSGVHEHHRAVDFRDEHAGGFTFTVGQSEHITEVLNEKYYRNDGKPTCLFHSFDGGPMHCHLQIAELTTAYTKAS